MGRLKRQLTDVEKSLVEAVLLGEVWSPEYYRDYLSGRVHQSRFEKRLDGEDGDEAFRSTRGTSDGKLEIAADIIVDLITNPARIAGNADNSEEPLISNRGICVKNARIVGLVDLPNVEFNKPIVITDCELLDGIVFSQSTLQSLNISRSRLKFIKADSCVIQSALSIGYNEVERFVDLSLAKVGGELLASGLKINLQGDYIQEFYGRAFHASGAFIGGSLYMRNGFHARGTVVFWGAQIGGSVFCTSSTFDHQFESVQKAHGYRYYQPRLALSLELAVISGHLFLDAGLSVTGLLDASRAKVAGTAHVYDAKFSNSETDCIKINGASIAGDIILGSNFEGAVNLNGTIVSGALIFQNGCSIEGELLLRTAQAYSVSGYFAPLVTKGHNIHLDGFVYERIDWHEDGEKQTYRNLLLRQPPADLAREFKPQPWTQIATVLRNMGYDRDARLVLEERERIRPVTGPLASRIIGHIKKGIIGSTAGYGYSPGRSLYGAIAIILLGWLIFGTAYRFELVRPTDSRMLARIEDGQPIASGYEAMKPWLYSIDLFVPIVDLSQDRYWLPKDPHEADVTVEQVREALPSWLGWSSPAVKWLFDGWLPKAWYWIQISLGWVLSTIAIAGFSGALKRD